MKYIVVVVFVVTNGDFNVIIIIVRPTIILSERVYLFLRVSPCVILYAIDYYLLYRMKGVGDWLSARLGLGCCSCSDPHLITIFVCLYVYCVSDKKLRMCYGS